MGGARVGGRIESWRGKGGSGRCLQVCYPAHR